MSLGNLKDQGNKGNNFPYQLSTLQLLSAINTSINNMPIGTDYAPRTTFYQAILGSPTAPGAGYTIGDILVRYDILTVPAGIVVATVWFNQTLQTIITGVGNPNSVDLIPWVPTGANVIIRTPSLIRATSAGSVAAGARAVSVYNAGSTNGVWLGAAILPGEQFSYDAGAEADILSAFAYTASATAILVITTVI